MNIITANKWMVPVSSLKLWIESGIGVLSFLTRYILLEKITLEVYKCLNCK